MGSCENGTTAILQALAKHELCEGESQVFFPFLQQYREKAWDVEIGRALCYITRSVLFITPKEKHIF